MIPVTLRGQPVQVFRLGGPTLATIAVGTTAATNTSAVVVSAITDLPPDNNVHGHVIVRVVSTVDCYVTAGTSGSATATLSSMPIFANTPENFAIPYGKVISAIASAGSGTLYVTKATT